MPMCVSRMAIPRAATSLVARGYPRVVLREMCMLHATRKRGPRKHVTGCMVCHAWKNEVNELYRV